MNIDMKSTWLFMVLAKNYSIVNHIDLKAYFYVDSLSKTQIAIYLFYLRCQSIFWPFGSKMKTFKCENLQISLTLSTCTGSF